MNLLSFIQLLDVAAPSPVENLFVLSILLLIYSFPVILIILIIVIVKKINKKNALKEQNESIENKQEQNNDNVIK